MNVCGAKRRHGAGTCQRPAGAGTDHKGEGRCSWHGGCSPLVNALGSTNPAFKHGLYSKTWSEQDQVEFNDYLEEHSWLDPTTTEAFMLFKAERALTLPGAVPPAVLVKCLQTIADIKERFKRLKYGEETTVHVQLEGERLADFMVAVRDVVLQYVPPADRHNAVEALREFCGTGRRGLPSGSDRRLPDAEYTAD